MTAGAARRILNSGTLEIKKKIVFVAEETREDIAIVARKHKFFSRYPGNLYVKEFRRDSVPPVLEERRMDTRDKKSKNTRNCIEQRLCTTPDQLVIRVVPRKK